MLVVELLRFFTIFQNITMLQQSKHNPINPNATIQLFCGLGMNYRGEASDSDGLFCFIVVA